MAEDLRARFGNIDVYVISGVTLPRNSWSKT